VTASTPVFLKDVASKELVPASLVIGLTVDQVDEAVALWLPFLHESVKESGQTPAHAHWDWSKKVRDIRGISGYLVAGVLVEDEVQAMLLWDDIASRGKHPSQLGKEIVYVHFLSTAPWNDPQIANAPRYRGTGTLLIAAAVAHSVEQEFKGRIGLHALEEAEPFYRDKCSMIDLGVDATHGNLRYFELTPDLGEALLNKTGVKL